MTDELIRIRTGWVVCLDSIWSIRFQYMRHRSSFIEKKRIELTPSISNDNLFEFDNYQSNTDISNQI